MNLPRYHSLSKQYSRFFLLISKLLFRNKSKKSGIFILVYLTDTRMNLLILMMGLLMTAFNIVYATHVVNIDWYNKVDTVKLHTACEQGGVYEQVGILQRRSCNMNFGVSLSNLDADDRVFTYRMGLLIPTFAVPILLLAVAILRRLSYSEKRSGYRRYGRRIWTRRAAYWRQKSISRAMYVVLARKTRLRRSTETAGSLESHKNPSKFFSTIQVVGEDGYNVVAPLPKADTITSSSLQKPKRITIQKSVVYRELRDRNFPEKPLPFIFNRKRTKRRIEFVRKAGNSFTFPAKRRKPQNYISKRRKKRIQRVNQQILKHEVVQDNDKIPIYPNYHHSYKDVLKLYKSIRKGSVFWPSKKVL